MKRINKQFLFIMTVAGIAFLGCSKGYLNVNSDPNRVTDVNVTAELIFPAGQLEVANILSNSSFSFLNHWVGYTAQNGTFAPQQNEITYNIDFSFGDGLWQGQYGILFDLHQSAVKGLASGDTALAGASMILSAKIWQDLVDFYGDIPYHQAFQPNVINSPAYDKGQDIYNDLEKKLDTAIIYLNTKPPARFAPSDIINHGNTGLWILFANTLKLRLLIRQSEIPGFDPSADIAKIIANGGVLGAGQSASVNPGFSNQAGKQSPFYGAFGFTPTGVQSSTAEDANSYIINILLTNSDPRLGRYFYPAGFTRGGKYVGDTYGDLQSNIPIGSASSYFGPGLIGDSTSAGDPTAGPGATEDAWIVPSFESMFWWAEAVARGWVPGNTDGAGVYAAALTENFVWLGVPNADSAAAAYIAAFPYPNGSAEVNDQFLANQKYLANVSIDPIEAYDDIRRLNMLTDNSYISIAPGRLGPGTIPNRLLFAQSEYTSNSTNVLKEGTINPFTSKVFWDTN
jgi:hypothetical protein